jgi:hypothetical protein
VSVFQPVDVRAPNNRRKQLIQKLMQQQQAQAPARSALMSVSNRLGRSPGGRATTLGHNNVLASVLSRLGVQGPEEVAPGASHAVGAYDPYSSGHYVSPQEVTPGSGNPIPAPVPAGGSGGGGPTNLLDAFAPTAPSSVTPNPAIYSDFNQTSSMTPNPAIYSAFNQPAPTQSLVSALETSQPGIFNPTPDTAPGLVPLGNGMYYDPVTDAVHGGR